MILRFVLSMWALAVVCIASLALLLTPLWPLFFVIIVILAIGIAVFTRW